MTARPRLFALVLLALALTACMPTRKDIRAAREDARALQETATTCGLPDHCAQPSALYDLAGAALEASRPGAPQHRVALLESGEDALLARINLIRAARFRLDVQSFIYAQDDAGFLVLGELLAAARRGVRVRVLLDQLYSVDDVEMVAALASTHANFELRLYNPTFGKAHTGPLEFAAGILCCFTRFNQRMHNKLLLADGAIGITGGRNYQDRYFDWDPGFNYRDRDILVAGPAAQQMQDSFHLFWRHPRSVPAAALRDVRRRLRGVERGRPLDRDTLLASARMPGRVEAMSRAASDAEALARRILERARTVGEVEYVSDLPNKPLERNHPSERDLSGELLELFDGAQDRIVLQTPYLVFSKTAQRSLRALQQRKPPPRIIVSTNSLAATDAFPVYALSHKYKRRYLREFGLHIYEYKPFPESIPGDSLEVRAPTRNAQRRALGDRASESRRAFGSGARDLRGSARAGRVPLSREGVRMGMHAKSMVIDERIALVGTHNFDPRSDRLNTESAVIVHDAAFARELAADILADTAPGNAWVIAPRPRPAVLSGLNYSLGKVFEALPLFDIWPFRYATSWEMKPGCAPVPRDDPRFSECYVPVGDFPQVQMPLKSIYTRVLTAFGAGLAPIL